MWMGLFRAVPFAAVTATCLIAQTPNDPVVAYSVGTTLTLANASGEATEQIKLNHPIYGFALSKDRRNLITVTPATEHGGQLALLNLRTHIETRLTHGRMYFKHLEKGETEVYSDPQFSPDGHSIVFGVHGNLPGDGNDAYENSGPVAIMDLRGHFIKILKSTTDIDGQGECSESDPMWSPDGKWILFNCEDGAFITDIQGKTLRNLKLEPEGDWGTGAVSWVGNGCVLYTRTPQLQGSWNHDGDELRLLNLHTNKAEDAKRLMNLPNLKISGLIEASDRALIRQSNSGDELFIETSKKMWEFPNAQALRTTNGASAHVIGGWSSNIEPRECE
jgi:hypothetical protein